MAVIGIDSILGSTTTSFPGRAFGHASGAYFHTAAADEQVASFAWYGNWGADGTDLNIEVGVYTTDNNVRPATLLISGALVVSSGTSQWWIGNFASTALVEGASYAIAWVARDSHSYVQARSSSIPGSSQDLVAGGPLDATWGHSANFSLVGSMYAPVIAVAAGTTGSTANISDSWKELSSGAVNIGDVWKTITSGAVNHGDVWKTITI